MNTYNIVQPSYWHCDGCDRALWDGEYRFNCTICDDFDYCEECKATIDPPHPHSMIRELAYGRPVNRNGDVPRNMAAGIRKAFELYSNRHCLGVRNKDVKNSSLYTDSYSWLTYKTVGERVINFGHGVRSLIEPRGYLGICAANRPEWLITDFACTLQSIISVPIYCLFNDREVAYVINNTQVSVVVCDKAMLPRFIRLGVECPSLRHIVCMDPISKISGDTHETHPSLHYIGDIEESGSMQKYNQVSMEPTDCMTIIYTSGSSGFPKGAIISEAAYRETFPNWFTSCLIERVTFCYRPLAWAADRDAATGCFLAGGRIGFSTGDVSRLMEELAIVRPTSFAAPPNFWNKIYAEYKAALSLINAQQHPSDSRVAEEQRLLRKFARLIPTRCYSITMGSAKISPTVLEFVKQCFKTCRISESYGITECGSVAYNNILEDTLEYRLESVPEMGYTVDDKPFPRGEILTKTTQMFSGYINNPEETRAALTDDGFFRTGDIVEFRSNKDGELGVHVIDRKKSFFKLAQGQFVSPEFLQSIYIRSPFVEQIYIHGDLLADCVAAVVVPNRAYAQAFALEHRLTNFDLKNPDPQFCNAVLQDLRALATEESLRAHEIPAKLVIDFEPFTPENGLLTASFKPCRHKLAAHYADRLKISKTIDQRLQSIIEMATGQSISTNEEEHSLLANGGNSLTAVRLSSMIEKDFGISIPIGILFEPTTTVQQLTNLIKDPSRISMISSRSIASQLWNDCQLNLNIKMNRSKTTIGPPSTVFITGTTGFVGAFLLAELLTVYPSNCKFICLVRCESSVNPLARIQKNMLFYQIWKDNYKDRIIPLRGDLATPSFGLDDQTYESLANQIDLIFHCGATVNFVLPYSKLYGPNVAGTREIIRLATFTSNYVPVQYISTVSVLSIANNEEISIDEIPPDGLVTGYGQSKWVAEKLMSKASQLGLPVVIYRLGSIGATTESGACNKNDIQTLLLAAIIKMRCYPETALHDHFDGLPADFTAKSIVHISRIQPHVYGKIYHVANSSNRVAFKDLIDCSHQCGIQLENVSYKEWRVKLKTITDRDSPFESVGEFLLDGALHEGHTLSTSQFYDAISALNFPSLDNDYMFNWLSFILHQIVR